MLFTANSAGSSSRAYGEAIVQADTQFPLQLSGGPNQSCYLQAAE